MTDQSDEFPSFQKEGELYIQRGEDGKALYAVGPGAGLPFALDYFPEAVQELRMATCYFQLLGFKETKDAIGLDVKLHILVGREEGAHVADVVTDVIASAASLPNTLLSELSQSNERLYQIVDDIVERIVKKQFFIAQAGEVNYGYSSLFHPKFYICDSTCMWSGSVNFTGRGLKRNYENAESSRDANKIAMYHAAFEDKSKTARNLLKEVEECLVRWRDMASPFDAYLKLLDWWHTEQKAGVKSGGKPPTYYQEAIISRAQEQINRYKGALILVATGLGKTVIGSELTARFTSRLHKPHTMLFAPRTVQSNWIDEELEPRDQHPHFFDIGLLFRKDSDTPEMKRLLQCLSQCNKDTLILIDEAHRYRGILDKDAAVPKAKKGASQSMPPRNRVKERLNEAAKKGANIVMLTATPYGTSVQNVKSLLSLLPPEPSNEVGVLPKPWTITTARQIASRPVVSILGITHLLRLAYEKGDTEKDGDGRNRLFIALPNGQKRYLPKSIVRNNQKYALLVEEEMEKAFEQGAFNTHCIFHQEYDEGTARYKPRAVDIGQTSARRAWFSSRVALELFLQKCCDVEDEVINADAASKQMTFDDIMDDEVESDEDEEAAQAETGFVVDEMDTEEVAGEKKGGFRFKMEQARRQQILLPILAQLRQLSAHRDEKLCRLFDIVQERRKMGEKIIVFVNRHSTAVYLHEALDGSFVFDRIACTAHKTGAGYKLDTPGNRLRTIRQFSPMSNQREGIAPWEDKFDLLICTDADGVGVNMEDACVVINYDPPDGADELFQRVGRIFRMTGETGRHIHVYTFFPVTEKNNRTAKYLKAAADKLTERHDVSSNIIGGSFLAHKDGEPEWGASVVSLAYPEDLDLLASQIGNPEDMLAPIPDPFMKHTTTFFRHQNQAGELPPVMLSAKYVRGKRAHMFLLVRYQNQFKQLLFNIENKQVTELNIERTLDLLRCRPDEEKAYIDPERIKETAQFVEHASLEAIQSWLGSTYDPNNTDDPIQRVCCVYLHPRSPRAASYSGLKEMLQAATRSNVPSLHDVPSVAGAANRK